MESTSLRGRSAVVTGSTRGLGAAFAEALAQAGANVVINGTTTDSTLSVVADLRARGLSVSGLVGSVADDAFCRELVGYCVTEFGGIDVLVNNAGITRDRSFTKMTVDDFDEVIAVHLRGTWSCSSAAARAMRSSGGGGAIINITSGSGQFGMFGQANYAAAKAGIISMSRVMDLELHTHGIAVNCVSPVAATRLTGVFDGDAGVRHDLTFPPPSSVAPIVVYLAGPDAKDVHGQCLSFDGTSLSVWSHPAESMSWEQENGWAAEDFADVLVPSVLEFPHPDRWGSGVGKP